MKIISLLFSNFDVEKKDKEKIHYIPQNKSLNHNSYYLNLSINRQTSSFSASCT